MMPKTISFGIIMLAAITAIHACSPSPENDGDGKTLATINDYRLPRNAFQRQLASELELEKDYKLTEDAKKEFLETLIRKELLIQEAMRLKLDRKEAFKKSIEKYWESTLIRDLITLKSLEISETIYISQEEIADRYAELKKSAPNIGPLTEKLNEQLQQELKASKKTVKLDAWIGELRSRAKIKIDEALLAGR
ncbi:MAG: SurA N-terminal domain-containing protein [Deltaproteobacteria bacterium]|nr:SurA N-terminal domain-containing protein [Deltaproteobacteria bacterium]